MAQLATRDQYWSGYMAPEYFPDKWAETNIYRDPEQLYDYNRGVIRDFSSDKPLFPDEEPVRGTDGGRSVGALNLRYSGDRADGVDPYTPDRFLGFTDKDPRGWTGEQPWQEFKNQMWHRAQNYEYAFQNDSDNSVPSQGIHPNTMYYNIRQGIQPQVQARFKNFGTSYDYQPPRGVLPFDIASDKGKIEIQKHIGSEINYDNPANINYTIKLSNDFENLGVTRSTPSHQFNVAQYGLVFKTVPCMALKRQITHTDMGSGQSKMCEKQVQNRKLFAEALGAMTVASGRKKAGHLRGEAFKVSNSNQLIGMIKSGAPPQDILKVAGYTDNEIKWMTSQMNRNSTAGNMNANPTEILHYVQLTGRAPPKVREWLIKNSFMLNNIGSNRRDVVVNPKLINFLEDKTRSRKELTGPRNPDDIDMTINIKNIQDIPIYVPKSSTLGNPRRVMDAGSVNIDEALENNVGSKLTHNYSSAFKYFRNVNPQNNVQSTQELFNPYDDKFYSNPGNEVRMTNRQDLEINDGTFSDSGFKDRKAGGIGGKYQRRMMDTSDFNNSIGAMNDHI